MTAERSGRLPSGLLMAIAHAESGRADPLTGAVRPWPWTINAENEGRYFASRAEAVAAVRTLQARGVRSIDVGCLQVNLMYHPEAFASLDAAFDPRLNALYAARFLNQLHDASHDWPQAIGSYHSATAALAVPYRALVMARWQRIAPGSRVPQIALAYGSFREPRAVYGAFLVATRSYGAFANPAAGSGASVPR